MPACENLHSLLPAPAAGAAHLKRTPLGGKGTGVAFPVRAPDPTAPARRTLGVWEVFDCRVACFGLFLVGRRTGVSLLTLDRLYKHFLFFWWWISKYVLIQTFMRSFLSLLSLLPFPFLNGKECLEGLLDRRLPIQSVYASKCVESLTLQVHFATFGLLTRLRCPVLRKNYFWFEKCN